MRVEMDVLIAVQYVGVLLVGPDHGEISLSQSTWSFQINFFLSQRLDISICPVLRVSGCEEYIVCTCSSG